jgi:pyruvate/2-oxoglutarate dehydrogenase complex dihydrolipoamide acyltransferase (E2) component
MRHQVKLPRLGDTTQSVLIAEWLVEVGQAVSIGAPLALVETDKVTTEVPSPVAGTVIEHLVPVQEEVDVGAPICVIEG